MQFGLVGEHQVDRAVAHQFEEFAAIAVDAERIRQRQRDLAAGLMRDRGRLDEGVLGVLRIPEITLEIEHACGGGDLIGVDSSGVSCCAAPSQVFMVRSPSGVTRM